MNRPGRFSQRRGWRVATIAIGAASLVLALAQVVPASAARTAPSNQRYHAAASVHAHRVGTVNLARLARADRGLRANGASPNASRHQSPLLLTPGAHSAARMLPHAMQAASTTRIRLRNVAGLRGFTGITAPVNAGVNPTIGDVSPPDQGLAVGPSPAGTAIVEFVNMSLEVFDTSGNTLLGALPAYQVFGQTSDAFLSDPRVYWDPQTGHWFLAMFDFTNTTSTQFIAVSQTTNPFGGFTVFSIDTTDASQPNCPCLGDYDQLGADANGIYIATNEFGLSNGYNGAVIYAMPKDQLVSMAQNGGGTPRVLIYRVPTDIFGQTYHISPASTPQHAAEPGTEYFVESNGDAQYGSSLEVYAMLHTSLLNTTGSPVLVSTPVTVNQYAFPPNALQRNGPNPLGQSVGEGVAPLQTDFDAVQEVTYSRGMLYGEYSTGVPYKTTQVTGAAWAVLKPN
ncbi:MAG: hypothetical protein ACRDPG_08055, partial [Nocardioidaceae bacterium]